jgi:hypothetical protein
MLAGSTGSDAISMQQKDASFVRRSLPRRRRHRLDELRLHRHLVGHSATLGGSTNTLDGR